MPLITISILQKKFVIVLALIIVALAAYWQVQYFEFVNYDDQLYITQNPKTQAGITFRTVIKAFSDVSMSNWHPLTMLSHALDWQFFGDNAGGHHWTNLFLHIFNTILLFLLLNIMTGSIWRSAAVAVLFAVHPINAESVAWVAQRKNLLSTFFWFLTMLLYAWYVRKPQWKRYGAMFFCFALGLMSKPMLVTLPFVLLLMDYWPLNRASLQTIDTNEQNAGSVDQKGLWFLLILEKIPLLILSAVFSGMALYTQNQANTMSSLDYMPIVDRASNALWSYVLYLKKMFWPMDLAVFYPYVDVPFKQALLAFALLTMITGICGKYHKRYPYLIVGWLWYLGTLVPVIGLIQIGAQSMADRYAYVSFIGLFIMTIWIGADVANKLIVKKLAAFTFFVIIVLLFYVARIQVQYWKNNYTIYTHAINTTVLNILPYKNLGLAMIEDNKPREAAILLHKAVRINGNDPSLRNSLGVALLMLGEYSEAEEQYKAALRLNPVHALAHNNLGMLYMNQNRTGEALMHFQQAIKIQPQFANAHYRLAILLRREGRLEESHYHYDEAVRIAPLYRGKMLR